MPGSSNFRNRVIYLLFFPDAFILPCFVGKCHRMPSLGLVFCNFFLSDCSALTYMSLEPNVHPDSVSLSSLVPAALLHILHLSCPAELFTWFMEMTLLWPLSLLLLLQSCEGHVCLKACVGRQNEEQKEGRLSFLWK